MSYQLNSLVAVCILLLTSCQRDAGRKRPSESSLAAEKAAMVSTLVQRGDQALSQNQQAVAWWCFRFASWYSPGDPGITTRFESLPNYWKRPLSLDEAMTLLQPSVSRLTAATAVTETTGSPLGTGLNEAFSIPAVSDDLTTDVLNLRMLLDTRLAGSLRCEMFSEQVREGRDRQRQQVVVSDPPIWFLTTSSINLDEVRQRYGPPSTNKKYERGAEVFTYGRVRLIGDKQGQILLVLFKPFS